MKTLKTKVLNSNVSDLEFILVQSSFGTWKQFLIVMWHPEAQIRNSNIYRDFPQG